MKFVLFVEGETERKSLPNFLKQWLDPQLRSPVGIKIVLLNGWSNLSQRLVQAELRQPQSDDVIAGLGLLDMHGPTYPAHTTSLSDRYRWKVQQIEQEVNHPKFRMFLAVHETEAWLLSQPGLFPREIGEAIARERRQPEAVNFNEPPKLLLDRLYRKHINRTYKKTVNGPDLFSRLDPSIAYDACPYLAAMLDAMLGLARNAVLGGI